MLYSLELAHLLCLSVSCSSGPLWCPGVCCAVYPHHPRHRTHGHSPGLVPVGRGCVAPGARGALLLTPDSPIPVIKVVTFPARVHWVKCQPSYQWHCNTYEWQKKWIYWRRWSEGSKEVKISGQKYLVQCNKWWEHYLLDLCYLLQFKVWVRAEGRKDFLWRCFLPLCVDNVDMTKCRMRTNHH